MNYMAFCSLKIPCHTRVNTDVELIFRSENLKDKTHYSSVRMIVSMEIKQCLGPNGCILLK